MQTSSSRGGRLLPAAAEAVLDRIMGRAGRGVDRGHQPKTRMAVGEYRDRTEAEAAFAERLATNPSLRECAERWAAGVRDVLSDRKARARFLRCGVITGIPEYADDILRRREEEQQARARASASPWSARGPLSAFATLGLPPHGFGRRDQAGLSPQGDAVASR
jgi:hypothetical protein